MPVIATIPLALVLKTLAMSECNRPGIVQPPICASAILVVYIMIALYLARQICKALVKSSSLQRTINPRRRVLI